MTTPQLLIGTVEPDGQQFDAFDDTPLLLSLEMGGIDWPSSCRNGTCRTCLGLLQEGAVRYDIDWPGLSAEEKQAGYVLPCVAYPCSPLRISRSS